MNRFILLLSFALLLTACQNDWETPRSVPPSEAPMATKPIAPGSIQSAAAPAVAKRSPIASAEGDRRINEQIDRLLGDHVAYRRVFDALQQAVAHDDAAAVADLVSFPITVSVDGKLIIVKNAARFGALYEKIMTPAVARAITGTAYDEVMVNSQGVMLGDGQAWISGICRDAACSQSEVKVIKLQSAPGVR